MVTAEWYDRWAMFDPNQIREPVFFYYARLGRVREYVEQHYHERITLRTAAQVAGLEPSYFSRFFHEKTGVKFSDWLTSIRINKAKRRMAERNTPITRVALAVGYRDLRTFERAFLRCAGMTPSAFKQSVQPR
jgi:two-component system response regulator YesN